MTMVYYGIDLDAWWPSDVVASIDHSTGKALELLVNLDVVGMNRMAVCTALNALINHIEQGIWPPADQVSPPANVRRYRVITDGLYDLRVADSARAGDSLGDELGWSASMASRPITADGHSSGALWTPLKRYTKRTLETLSLSPCEIEIVVDGDALADAAIVGSVKALVSLRGQTVSDQIVEIP